MSRLATIGLALAACTLTLAQGPDVIVGALIDTQLWGSANGYHAYSVGTESCNIGTQNLTWNANTNQHPVIAQNMYRLKDGRFQQIGMSWLKHGFYALSLSLCNTCQTGSPDGSWLGIGCSDPYGATLNGSQGLLGPRNEVNASTGYFPYPVAGSYPSPNPAIGQRIQVLTTDLTPNLNPGALYFVEGHYVHPEDAAAGNKNNNASYRAVSVAPTTYQLSFLAPTQQMKPGLEAWKDTDPTVQLFNIDVPGDGRFLVAFKGTPLPNGQYHYEYAVQNLNSDRSMGVFSVELWPGATPTNMGFHAVPYHDGEPYSSTPWTTTYNPGSLFPGQLIWQTATFATNPDANALRWGNMYNFWFDCDQLPGNVTLGLFKPGNPATVSVPAFCPPRRPPPPPPAPYTLVTSTPYDYVNISATGTPLPSGDDVGYTVPIPFPFPFYGQTYNSCVISTNGYVTLPGQDGTLHSNTTLPAATTPNGIIAAYWDDLFCPLTGSIKYQLVNNRFVIYWNAVHLGNAQPMQFELILEPSGSIVSTIVTSPGAPYGGLTATRGIESWDNTAGLLLSYNTPGSAFSGTSVRYEVNTGVPISSNLFVSGSLGGGMFKLTYVSGNNSPVLTMVSLNPGPTSLGPYGSLPLDFYTAIGLYDYFGILTGFPNPGATTNGTCGAIELQFFMNPGSLPSGFLAYVAGVNFSQTAPNTAFDISNGVNLLVP
jgi:hypothetical protein